MSDSGAFAPVRAPDKWERLGLHKLKSGAPEIIDFSDIGGAPYLRIMRLMRMKPSCDKCHGHLGFKTGDDRPEGTGLGLPLTQGLIEAHGGTLAIQSEPGAGTTITVGFPADRVIVWHKAAIR